MIAELAGVTPDEITLHAQFHTEALEMAEFGLNLKPGDEILTTNQDYPAHDDCLTSSVSAVTESSPDATRRFRYQSRARTTFTICSRKAITPQTKVIHFCHITNRTGVIFPVRRLCDMAAAKGIVTVVDGAHAFSQFPFKVS